MEISFFKFMHSAKNGFHPEIIHNQNRINDSQIQRLTKEIYPSTLKLRSTNLERSNISKLKLFLIDDLLVCSRSSYVKYGTRHGFTVTALIYDKNKRKSSNMLLKLEIIHLSSLCIKDKKKLLKFVSQILAINNLPFTFSMYEDVDIKLLKYFYHIFYTNNVPIVLNDLEILGLIFLSSDPEFFIWGLNESIEFFIFNDINLKELNLGKSNYIHRIKHINRNRSGNSVIIKISSLLSTIGQFQKSIIKDIVSNNELTPIIRNQFKFVEDLNFDLYPTRDELLNLQKNTMKNLKIKETDFTSSDFLSYVSDVEFEGENFKQIKTKLKIILQDENKGGNAMLRFYLDLLNYIDFEIPV